MTDLSASRDKFVEANGLRLHYMDWGNPQGQPMLLLHGLGDSGCAWEAMADSMRSEYHVLALDLRGHGDSQWSDKGAYRLKDYLGDVHGLIDGLPLESVVLAGHAWGGLCAIAYAASYPQHVDKLIVVEAAADGSGSPLEHLLRRYTGECNEWASLDAVVEHLRLFLPDAQEDVLRRQAACVTSEGPGGRRRWRCDPSVILGYRPADLWKEWQSLRCPVLVVRGRQSNILTHETAVKMRESIQAARLAELEGGGHWIHLEFPGAFEATVRWFLESPPS